MAVRVGAILTSTAVATRATWHSTSLGISRSRSRLSAADLALSRKRLLRPVVIDVLHLQGVFLNELAPRLHFFAHQDSEHLVRFEGILEMHLQQHPFLGIEGCLPELFSVHLAQAFEAGYGQSALAEPADFRDQFPQVRQGAAQVAVLQDEARPWFPTGDPGRFHHTARIQAELPQALQAAVDAANFMELLPEKCLPVPVDLAVAPAALG